MRTDRILAWLRSHSQPISLVTVIAGLALVYNWHRLFPTSPHHLLEGSAWIDFPVPEIAERLVLHKDGRGEHSHLELSGRGRFTTTPGLWYLVAHDKGLCFQPINNSGVPWGPPECRALSISDEEGDPGWMNWGFRNAADMGFMRDSYRKPRKR